MILGAKITDQCYDSAWPVDEMAKKLNGNTTARTGIDDDECNSVQPVSVGHNKEDWLVFP